MQQAFLVDVLERMSGLSAGILRKRALLFQKGHQTSRQRPKAQNHLKGHELVMITAQQILIIPKESFDIPVSIAE
jgi:hypothetical protein